MKDKIINYLNENIISYVKENKFKILIPIVLLLISTFEFIYFYKSIATIKSEKNNSNILNMNIQNKKENIEKNESQKETQEFIYVDIKGEVKNPNVYKMKVGSRVNDLINEAGGLTKNANTRFISLSKILEDENTIVIYSNKEKSEETDLFQDLIGNNENTMVMAPISEDTNKETLKEELESMTQDLERIKQPINDLTQDLILEKEKLKKLSPEEINNRDIDYEDTTRSKTEEFENSQIEKSFFTNSMSFSKKDFEGFEDLENNMKKSSFFTKIAIFLIILMLLGTIFIILNYVLDLKIF